MAWGPGAKSEEEEQQVGHTLPEAPSHPPPRPPPQLREGLLSPPADPPTDPPSYKDVVRAEA